MAGIWGGNHEHHSNDFSSKMQKDMRLLKLLVIKGERDGLHLFCSTSAPWGDVIKAIKTRLTGEYHQFFAGASVIVELGTRRLTVEEMSQLWAVLLECQVKIKGIRLGETEVKNEVVKLSATESLSQKPLYLAKKNLRSGQNITFDGHVLIWGDVNPGAEVIATGFIIVLGALRGTAHAGAGGDEEAWVMAGKLQPTQLRIADYIARAPQEEPQGPEIARIKAGTIICELL
jgi:septum site-determining protein MinC